MCPPAPWRTWLPCLAEEHDFGAIDWHGECTFWKIDYYDQTLTFGEDPLSTDCQRVLTVLLASEY
jgi:hypothetical protein